MILSDPYATNSKPMHLIGARPAGRSRKGTFCGSSALALASIASSFALASAASAQSLPSDGVVVVGNATIPTLAPR
jgi:hypothetical protein